MMKSKQFGLVQHAFHANHARNSGCASLELLNLVPCRGPRTNSRRGRVSQWRDEFAGPLNVVTRRMTTAFQPARFSTTLSPIIFPLKHAKHYFSTKARLKHKSQDARGMNFRRSPFSRRIIAKTAPRFRSTSREGAAEL